jgi:hypothetical protein
MNDETALSDAEPAPEPRVTAGEAWQTVVARMGDLSAALTAWASASANEPDTKEKLDQVRAGIDEIRTKADAAMGAAMRSQAGQAIGNAAKTVTDATAPHVSTLFTELSNIFATAARKVDEATRTPEQPPAPAEDAAPAQKDPLQGDDD